MMQASPRWDGHRLLFMLALEGGGEVRCAISRLALLGISGGGLLRSIDLPALFAIARPRIEAAARAKLSARSSPPLGVLHIWEEDILDPSPGASPRAMEASMRRG